MLGLLDSHPSNYAQVDAARNMIVSPAAKIRSHRIMQVCPKTAYHNHPYQQQPERPFAIPPQTSPPTQGDIDFPIGSATQGGVLFSHPKDFTPVARQNSEPSLARPNSTGRMKVIAPSVDSIDSHVGGKTTSPKPRAPVNFPMIGDSDRTVSDLYDMITRTRTTP